MRELPRRSSPYRRSIPLEAILLLIAAEQVVGRPGDEPRRRSRRCRMPRRSRRSWRCSSSGEEGGRGRARDGEPGSQAYPDRREAADIEANWPTSGACRRRSFPLDHAISGFFDPRRDIRWPTPGRHAPAEGWWRPAVRGFAKALMMNSSFRAPGESPDQDRGDGRAGVERPGDPEADGRGGGRRLPAQLLARDARGAHGARSEAIRRIAEEIGRPARGACRTCAARRSGWGRSRAAWSPATTTRSSSWRPSPARGDDPHHLTCTYRALPDELEVGQTRAVRRRHGGDGGGRAASRAGPG